MKYVMLALIVSLVLFTPARAALQPPDRPLDREAVLEKLVDAENTFHSWNIAGTKSRLDQLVTDLAHDTTPFNQAVRARATEIVKLIDASHLRDAETKLAALVKAVRDGVMPSFGDLGDTAI